MCHFQTIKLKVNTSKPETVIKTISNALHSIGYSINHRAEDYSNGTWTTILHSEAPLEEYIDDEFAEILSQLVAHLDRNFTYEKVLNNSLATELWDLRERFSGLGLDLSDYLLFTKKWARMNPGKDILVNKTELKPN